MPDELPSKNKNNKSSWSLLLVEKLTFKHGIPAKPGQQQQQCPRPLLGYMSENCKPGSPPFPRMLYHSIVPTGVVVKQIPARLQSQHCKQFDQTLYGCTCKKEIENSPFPAPYQALSVVVPLSLSGSAYPRICGGIPHMTVYLTVYMSWRTASTSVCTYRLLIRRVVPKC